MQKVYLCRYLLKKCSYLSWYSAVYSWSCCWWIVVFLIFFQIFINKQDNQKVMFIRKLSHIFCSFIFKIQKNVSLPASQKKNTFVSLQNPKRKTRRHQPPTGRQPEKPPWRTTTTTVPRYNARLTAAGPKSVGAVQVIWPPSSAPSKSCCWDWEYLHLYLGITG